MFGDEGVRGEDLKRTCEGEEIDVWVEGRRRRSTKFEGVESLRMGFLRTMDCLYDNTCVSTLWIMDCSWGDMWMRTNGLVQNGPEKFSCVYRVLDLLPECYILLSPFSVLRTPAWVHLIVAALSLYIRRGGNRLVS